MSKKNQQENKMPEETTPEKPVTDLAVPPPVESSLLASGNILSPSLADLVRHVKHPMFTERFEARLRTVTRPSLRDITALVDTIPDEYKAKVVTLLKKMDPNRPGLYLADHRPQFTELRVFQGTGNDPNRPENVRVGHFYLNTKQNVGDKFVGTLLAVWQGRTMWPGADEARGAPLCTSMDRRVGSKYGDCETCPQRPWRDGEKTSCNDDVVAFMLPKEMDDIIMVRFSRTSEAAGRQLSNFATKEIVPWRRFYQLTTSERQGQGGSKIKWHVIKVEPLEELVPTELMDFCAALCNMAEHDFILPGLARIYNDAANIAEGAGLEPAGEKVAESSSKSYDDFDDKP